MSKVIQLSSALAVAALLTSGCSQHYVNPGRPADLAFLRQDEEVKDAAADERPIGNMSFAEILARHPTASFPTSIAVVRLQAPAGDTRGQDRGARPPARMDRFTVVTRRDVETDACLERLRALPQVAGIAGVNQLLLPPRIGSDVDLRKIAAQMRADMLLVYTLDTHEELDDENPLFSFLTFGLLPTHEVEVRTTASAVLLDTRTGYCYGLAEGTAFKDPHTSFWQWEEETEDTRLATEREAFAELVESFATTWDQVVTTYAGAIPTQ